MNQLEKEKKNRIYDELLSSYSERIKEILNLNMNWDGYDSKGYKKHTITNTILFLSKLYDKFQLKYKTYLPRPYLFPGDEGSLNIEWKNDNFDLLITIPEEITELAGLYGINSMKNEVKYNFKIFKIKKELLSWLKESI